MSPKRLDDLSPEQQKAVLALLNQPTIAKAAEECGVTTRTMYRWMDEPAFGEAYRRARRQAFSQAISMSQKYAPVALQALAKIVTDEKQPTSCRVSAASAILKFSRESLELDDLAARLDAVEAQVRGDAPVTHTMPPEPIDPEPMAEAA
jgi:hypothetical protein